VNATVEHPNWFDHLAKYMRIPVADERESNLFDKLSETTKFIMSALSGDGTVLVHCNQGVSRSSTVTIAFLMERFNWTLETSYEFLKDRRPGIRPNRGFLQQLSLWEKSVHGRVITDIDELW
jgi:protein-tyrosine phosphatase